MNIARAERWETWKLLGSESFTDRVETYWTEVYRRNPWLRLIFPLTCGCFADVEVVDLADGVMCCLPLTNVWGCGCEGVSLKSWRVEGWDGGFVCSRIRAGLSRR